MGVFGHIILESMSFLLEIQFLRLWLFRVTLASKPFPYNLNVTIFILIKKLTFYLFPLMRLMISNPGWGMISHSHKVKSQNSWSRFIWNILCLENSLNPSFYT